MPMSTIREQRWLSALVVLSVTSLSGAFAHLLHIPLAWLLGALLASTALALKGITFNLNGVRPYVLIFLGLALGQTFNSSVMSVLLNSLPAIIVCSLLTVLVGVVGGKVFVRYAGLDAKTAFFCGIPGGVVLMAIHAKEAGLSEQHVVFSQSVRLIIVVLLYPVLVSMVPHGESLITPLEAAASNDSSSYSHLLLWWLAGLGAAILGKKIGIPNPWMLAPCILAAVFSSADLTSVSVPDGFVTLAQIVLGITLGANMTAEFIRDAHKLISASVLSSLVLSALLITLSVVAAWMFGLPLSAALLGMAPGGMPEMAVTAHALETSVPLVLGFHFVRVVFCNLLLDVFWRCVRTVRLM